jgi:hypothetical protein
VEISCQTCGTKVETQSFLVAAQQPCVKCGQLLIGRLSSGTRTARPAGFDNDVPAALEMGSGGSSGIWTGMVLGILVGVGIVALMAYAGPAIPTRVRGAVLYALMGVLLSPILAISSFISMLVLPFSLEGILGDGMWTRLARANNERRIGPLIVPFLVFVGLPMGLCGLGGLKLSVIETPAVVGAALGAVLLGAILGMMVGARFGTRRTPA